MVCGLRYVRWHAQCRLHGALMSGLVEFMNFGFQ